MRRGFSTIAAAAALLVTILGSVGALAQKSGGILKMYDFASPASMSTHDEATLAAVTPLMDVFNNLVLFDQHVPQNSLASVVPDLATAWSWDEADTAKGQEENAADRLQTAAGQTTTRRRATLDAGPDHDHGEAGDPGWEGRHGVVSGKRITPSGRGLR